MYIIPSYVPENVPEPEKKCYYKNYFSISTFITIFFSTFYYKNGETPDLVVWLANKVPEGGVTGENFINKFHSEFY